MKSESVIDNLVLVIAFTVVLGLQSGISNAQEPSPQVPDAQTAIQKRFDREIEQFVKRLEDDAKEVYQKYRSADRFPDQNKRLVGRWYGAAEDPDNQSYWRYQRNADGTVVIKSIDLDRVSMEYTRDKEQAIWRTEGRVLFEFCENRTDGSDPLSVFLLDAVTKDQVEYHMAFVDEPAQDWITDIDRAGPGPPVKLPEDFEELQD